MIIDETNQSGLGTGTDPVLLAYYTSAYNYDAPGRGRQAQSLAYSTDRGRTWQFYSGNPLIAIDPANNPEGYNANEFRDPKVFYYAPHDKWVMPLVLPLDHKVQFYQSTDLLSWSLMSEFGPGNSDSGMWEMPDLIPLPVDGDPANEKWVLALSVNGGTPYGGSGIQYFVGDFDGATFSADNLTPKTFSGGTAFEDFETDLAQWTLAGDAFSLAPADGRLTDRDGNPIQGAVTGYQGSGLINTFRRYDASVGVATSAPFTINSDYINLRVGGGQHPYYNRSRAGVLSHPDATLFETFDRANWGNWQASGDAFTDGSGQDSTSPFNGWYDGIGGIEGTSLLHSYRPAANGDAATGTLVSPSFTIDQGYLHFKIGGGFHPPGDPNGETLMKLVVNGVIERWATGFDANQLHWRSWNLAGLAGQTAHIEISDQNSGGWGQIQVDHILFSDDPALFLTANATLLYGFDGDGFDGWSASGTAFAGKPEHGGWTALPNFLGNSLVHSYNTDEGGDAATGTLTSPSFTLNQPYLNLLVGGGNKPAGHTDGEAQVKLMVGGQEVASSTGRDANVLDWHSWDLSAYLGQTAQLIISDQNTATWGQIQVDHIVASDAPIDQPATATLFEDFETALDQWTLSGDAHHFRVSQYHRCSDGEDLPEAGVEASFLVNSFYCGDEADGTLADVGFKDEATGSVTSPEFILDRNFIHLKMGGGQTMAAEVLVGGQVVASYQQPEDSWTLSWGRIDVSGLQGQTAQLRFTDNSTAGWGFFLVDHIAFSDAPYAPAAPTSEATAVNLVIDGQRVHTATGNNSEQLDWAVWDVSAWQGKTAQLEIVDFNSGGWGHLLVDDIRFSAEPAPDAARRADWVDWGKDFYAGITFHNYPGSAPAWLAWTNNWQYAGDIPTSPFRGAQSLVRTLGLVSTASGPALTQTPVGLDSLHLDTTPFSWSSAVTLADETVHFEDEFEAGTLLDIDWELEPQGAGKSGLRLRYGANHWVEVMYDADSQELAVDRSHSGQTGFSREFSGIHGAPVTLDGQGRVSVRMILDWSMVEVFAQGGQQVITDRIFPPQGEVLRLEAFARDGQATVHSLNVRRLESVWSD